MKPRDYKKKWYYKKDTEGKVSRTIAWMDSLETFEQDGYQPLDELPPALLASDTELGSPLSVVPTHADAVQELETAKAAESKEEDEEEKEVVVENDQVSAGSITLKERKDDMEEKDEQEDRAEEEPVGGKEEVDESPEGPPSKRRAVTFRSKFSVDKVP